MNSNFYHSGEPLQSTGVENGGMFSREKIQQLSKQVMNIYSNGSSKGIEPPSVARCMIDTYRGMNKHFIPTGHELSSFAKVFDKDRKGFISEQDVLATATRMFLINNSNQGSFDRGFRGGNNAFSR